MGLPATTRNGLQLVLQVALALALFAVVQILATRHNLRFDLTPEKSFVLSDASAHVAAATTVPVRITLFYNSQEPEQRRDASDLLDQFRAAAPAITYRLLDLDRSPALADKYGVTSYNTGVLEAEGRTIALKSIDEETITAALLKATRQRTRTLCFVTGHGEHSPEDNSEREGYSEIGKALERENFAVRSLDSIPVGGVPAECEIVVLAGPSRDLLPGEAEALLARLAAGGRVFILVDPGAPPSVLELLRRSGVQAGNDIIIDDRNRFYGADSFMPRVPIFDQGTYGKNLESAAVLALARTVIPLTEDGTANRRSELIAMTSPESWARVDGGTVDQDVQFRKGIDRPGPLPIGVMVTFDGPAGGSGRLVVVGDSDFANNFNVNLLGNRDFFLSTVAVLAEEPQLIAVRRKGPTRGSISPISLTASEGSTIFWAVVVVLPFSALLTGTLMAVRRRRRSGGR